jgi:integrase
VETQEALNRIRGVIRRQHKALSTEQTYAFLAAALHSCSNALRAKRPVHARHAPTVTETQLLLQALHDVDGYPTNLIARLLYGCGLRISEPLNLRIKALNLEQPHSHPSSRLRVLA